MIWSFVWVVFLRCWSFSCLLFVSNCVFVFYDEIKYPLCFSTACVPCASSPKHLYKLRTQLCLTLSSYRGKICSEPRSSHGAPPFLPHTQIHAFVSEDKITSAFIEKKCFATFSIISDTTLFKHLTGW